MSHTATGKPVGKTPLSPTDFDTVSEIIAAARAARSEYLSALVRSWDPYAKATRSLNDFKRLSEVVAVARARRAAFLHSLFRSPGTV